MTTTNNTHNTVNTNNVNNAATVSVKEFNAMRAEGSKQVNAFQKSPYQIINTLNRIATFGEVERINYEEGTNLEANKVAEVAAVLKTMHTYSEPFARCLLERNSRGEFCQLPKRVGYCGEDLENGTAYTVDAYEVCGAYDIDEEAHTFVKPITPTLSAYYNTFAALAASRVKIAEREAKKAAKAEAAEAKKAAKAEAKRAKEAEKTRKAAERAALAEMKKASNEAADKWSTGQLSMTQYNKALKEARDAYQAALTRAESEYNAATAA